MDHSRLVVVPQRGHVVGLRLEEVALLEQLPPNSRALLFPAEDCFLSERHFGDDVDEAVLGLDGEGAAVAGVEVEEKVARLIGALVLQDGVDVVLDDLGVRPEELVVHAVVADVSGRRLQLARTVGDQFLLGLLQELLYLLYLLQLFYFLRLLSDLLVLVGLLLPGVEDGLGLVDQHVESTVFFLVLKRGDQLVASKVALLKCYPLLRIGCEFPRSDFFVQTLPLALLDPVVAVCLGLVEQFLLELERVQPHQFQRVPDEGVLDAMIQRRFCGERRRVVDLQQHWLQRIGDEDVKPEDVKGHPIVVLFRLRGEVVVLYVLVAGNDRLH